MKDILFIRNVNLELLDQQRKALIRTTISREIADKDSELIDGLLNMLDHWSDARYFKQQDREKYLAQLISPDSPMTTNQAEARYECEHCKLGIGCCYNCVESNTGSTICPTCNGRVWFNRERPITGTVVNCPYCENDLVIIRNKSVTTENYYAMFHRP